MNGYPPLMTKRFKIKLYPRFLEHLEKFSSLSLLKNATIYLDLTALSSFDKYIDILIKNFPQTDSVKILIRQNKCWNLLNGYNNLKKVNVNFSTNYSMDRNLQNFKETFPVSHSWQIYFGNLHKFQPVESYSKENEIKNDKIQPMSIDDFIELEILQTMHTKIFDDKKFSLKHPENPNFYLKIKQLLKEIHIERLIKEGKFDPEATSLDLNHAPLSDKSFHSLIKATPKLQKLQLLNVPVSLYAILPSFISKLKEVQLPSTLITPNNFRNFIENFLKKNKTYKTLEINFDLTGNLPFNTIPFQMLMALCSRCEWIRVKFSASKGVFLELNKRVITLYPSNLYNTTTCKQLVHHSLAISQRDFVTQISLSSFDHELIDAFVKPYFNIICAIEISSAVLLQRALIPIIKKLPYFQKLTILLNFFKEEKEKELINLTEYLRESFGSFNAAISLEGPGMDDELPIEPEQRLKTFIERAKVYLPLIPNYNPFLSPLLTNEIKAYLTDEQLLSLKPVKFKSSQVINFSDMSQISGKAIIEFLKEAPPTVKIRVNKCQRLTEDISNGLIPFEDLFKIELLREGYSLLFSKNLAIRAQMNDQHVNKLFEEKKIDPNTTLLNLIGMPHVTLEGFEFILEKLTKVNTLLLEGVDPSLYNKLPELAPRLDQVMLPIEIAKTEIFPIFLNEMILSGDKKIIIIKCDQHPEMIGEIIPSLSKATENLTIVFVLNKIQLKLDKDYHTIILPAAIINELLPESLEPFITLAQNLPTFFFDLDFSQCCPEKAEELLTIFCQKFSDKKIEWINLGT